MHFRRTPPPPICSKRLQKGLFFTPSLIHIFFKHFVCSDTSSSRQSHLLYFHSAKKNSCYYKCNWEQHVQQTDLIKSASQSIFNIIHVSWHPCSQRILWEFVGSQIEIPVEHSIPSKQLLCHIHHLGFWWNTLEDAILLFVSVKRYLGPVSCTELPKSKHEVLKSHKNAINIRKKYSAAKYGQAIKNEQAFEIPSKSDLSTLALNLALLWVQVRFLHSSSDRIHSFTWR